TRARRVSVAIACAILAVLAVASLFAELRGWIMRSAPIETTTALAEPPVGEGRVIYRHASGTSCQHRSFDNKSGKLSKAVPGPCDTGDQKSRRPEGSPGFVWGTR